MTESIFIDSNNWYLIERGFFFQAAMSYYSDQEQPLRFLKRDEEGNLIIERENGNFDPVIIDGRPRAVEQDIVITVKPRQVIILSNNILNKSKDYDYVQVAPIMGLKERDLVKNWYQDLINDSHIGFAYIPRGLYGIEVDLTQITTIHKSMLLKKQTKVPEDRMKFIDSHIAELLDM
ncbi:type II toxin-antitoxin system PemK/MazF family toxin [Bacillus sp. 2205SS5-2]|uniref:type II toxin-antitoxin system PemK/MazF family toxin n=1 Tax=Bacillus sp. 2205SS5-2 TaxID=3109031 RepID=UPI003006D658